MPAIRAIMPPVWIPVVQSQGSTSIGGLRTLRLIYPWRCLCFGFSQITLTTPRRRTILHLAQILRTDERTFMATPVNSRKLKVRVRKLLAFDFRLSTFNLLLIPVNNPAASQVIGRQFHLHFVPGKNFDEILPHLPRDVRQDLVLVLQLNPKHRIRQRFDHRRSEEHTSELQSLAYLVCRLLLEKK